MEIHDLAMRNLGNPDLIAIVGKMITLENRQSYKMLQDEENERTVLKKEEIKAFSKKLCPRCNQACRLLPPARYPISGMRFEIKCDTCAYQEVF